MTISNGGRTPARDLRVGRGLMLFVLGAILLAGSPEQLLAATRSDARSSSAEDGDQLIRRCKWQSKVEVCYWQKVSSPHASEH
jgi:hypothetical protein